MSEVLPWTKLFRVIHQDSMNGPGTISWDEFLLNAKSFVRASDEISDSWNLHGDEETPGQAYLSRRSKIFVSSEIRDKLVGESSSELLNNCKDPFEADDDQGTPMILEHHVLWSMSYGVPVLYFNAWLSDFPGVNPVAVESVQNSMKQGAVGYNELSQAIHPILGTTFLHFHPCMSQELIQNTSTSKNKLVSWLSAVAPSALNLKLALEYFSLTQND